MVATVIDVVLVIAGKVPVTADHLNCTPGVVEAPVITVERMVQSNFCVAPTLILGVAQIGKGK